ncbi:hypothetical protein BDR04DRAFT_1098438 [Suillus decipiens]|nr:hypothetical protein BDR04DRAFT_1098438 [Suillus decipiens]
MTRFTMYLIRRSGTNFSAKGAMLNIACLVMALNTYSRKKLRGMCRNNLGKLYRHPSDIYKTCSTSILIHWSTFYFWAGHTNENPTDVCSTIQYSKYARRLTIRNSCMGILSKIMQDTTMRQGDSDSMRIQRP